MTNKFRLSASVDADLVAQAEVEVGRGRAPNLSAWVNDALRLKLAHDRRMTALADVVAAHEAKHGVITPEEIAAARRWAREQAVVVRGAPLRARKTRRSA